MQILTATIVISGSDYVLTIPDSKGQAPIKVGEGELTQYQIEKELFKSGDIVAYKSGKSPCLVAPANALGVAMGTVKTIEYEITPNGFSIVKVSLDRDGGYARIKYSGKLPVNGGEVLVGSSVQVVGVASAYCPADKEIGYVSIWASSVEVMELSSF